MISAIRELNIDQRLYTIETLTCDDFNVNHYSIKDIVKWLLQDKYFYLNILKN